MSSGGSGNDDPGGWFAAVDAAAAIPHVAEWRLGRAGSGLRALRRAVPAEVPPGPYREAIVAAWEILDRTPMRQIRPILEHPAFELWLDGCLDLVSRGVHRRLGGGATLAHLSALATFAATVAEPGRPVRVRVDAAGSIPLRGTGHVLMFPADQAGTWSVVHREPGGGWRADGGRLVQPAYAGDRWELNRHDRLLSARPRPSPEDVPDEAAGAAAERAWQVAARVLPRHTAGLADVSWVVVPVSTDRPVSPARLGRWELPVRAGPPEAAAELVTAAAGARVVAAVAHALAGVPHPRPAWRRIEPAVRRAASARADEAFWRACASALDGPAGGTARRRADEAARRRSAAVRALPDLAWLPTAVHELLISSDDGPAPRPGSARAPAQLIPSAEADRVARFEAAWRAAGGRHRDRLRSPASLSAATGAAARIAGIDGGVVLNLPYRGADRSDGSLDRLGLAAVREPELLDRIRAALAVAPVTADPVDHLLRGHLDYLAGEMLGAARHYATAVRSVPDGLDLWQDLAFALLHLGRPESRVFRFAPDLLGYAASGITADPAVARRVAGAADDDLGEHADLACVLLIIRAVDRATGLGLI